MSEGLRSQKKQETRRNISDVATRLFIREGFEEVTIADIAVAARVAKMTVTNHFPRKEDLVFDARADFVAWPGTAIKEDALPDVREAYFDALATKHAFVGFSGRAFVRMIKESPTLVAALRELHREREETLTDVLIPRRPGDNLGPVLAAAHLGAVLRVLFTEVFEQTAEGVAADDIEREVKAAAVEAFGQLEPMLSGY